MHRSQAQLIAQSLSVPGVYPSEDDVKEAFEKELDSRGYQCVDSWEEADNHFGQESQEEILTTEKYLHFNDEEAEIETTFKITFQRFFIDPGSDDYLYRIVVSEII